MNIIGEKFGKLTVIEMIKVKGLNNVKCKCECGREHLCQVYSVTSGRTKSCGCLKKEQDKSNLTANHSHKMSKERVYTIWQGIKARCTNKNNKRYDNYGGRGISVCEEWNEPINFIEWALSNGYDDNLTIERIDVNGNYEPRNCTWATSKEQCNNRTSNVFIEYEGNMYTLMQLSELLEIEYKVIYSRYRRGDRGARLLRLKGEDKPRKGINSKVSTEKVICIKKMLLQGKKRKEISETLGVSVYIVDDIRKGKTWTHIQV